MTQKGRGLRPLHTSLLHGPRCTLSLAFARRNQASFGAAGLDLPTYPTYGWSVVREFALAAVADP